MYLTYCPNFQFNIPNKTFYSFNMDAILKMALFPNKNCTSRGIISFRKNILREAQKKLAGILMKTASLE